jgi:hypothetical protein
MKKENTSDRFSPFYMKIIIGDQFQTPLSGLTFEALIFQSCAPEYLSSTNHHNCTFIRKIGESKIGHFSSIWHSLLEICTPPLRKVVHLRAEGNTKHEECY